MKRMLAALLLAASINAIAQEQLPDWAFGPFIRPANANPVLSPIPKAFSLIP